MHRPYIAYFIGSPSQDSMEILAGLRLLVEVNVVPASSSTIQQIEEARPDFVFLSTTCAAFPALHLFRHFRRHGRTSTLVWSDGQITAFTGPGYRWHRQAPKTLQGLEDLLTWTKWPLPINRRQAQKSVVSYDMSFV